LGDILPRLNLMAKSKEYKMKQYKDETYWKYKNRDRKIRELQREKDLVDPNVSFEEYMDKHEKPEGNKPVITEDEKREFEHDMFRQKQQKQKIDDIYFDVMEKINDAHDNMMKSALQLMRKKREEGEI
tara:strand:+ start:1206 stop:1589 length:384 start_codon:yes stop_codon:yes gene_type:complete